MLHPHVLRDMALFVEVAKRGSFSRAAEALDMPISSLSRRIMLFEAAIGLRLIARTTRTLTLTHHGETYLPRAARLVEEAQRTVEEMLAQAKGPSEQVRIAVPAEPWMLEAIANALAEATLPERVLLHVGSTTAGTSAAGFDLTVTTGVPIDDAADLTALADLDVGVYASPAYLDRRGAPVEPNDLERHEAVLVARHHHAEWRLLREDEPATVRVTGRISCENADLARRLAVGGLGIIAAAAPEVAGDVRRGRLMRVMPSWRLATRPVYTVAARPLPPQARVWVEGMIARIRAAATEPPSN